MPTVHLKICPGQASQRESPRGTGSVSATFGSFCCTDNNNSRQRGQSCRPMHMHTIVRQSKGHPSALRFTSQSDSPQRVGEHTLHRRAFFAVDAMACAQAERPVSWLPLSSLPCCMPPTRLSAPPPSVVGRTRQLAPPVTQCSRLRLISGCAPACGTAQRLCSS